MPYVGGSLTSLFGRGPQAATTHAASSMASRGGESIHELAAENTPVRTGNLRTAWHRGPVVEEAKDDARAFSSTVENPVSYAADVEYGTGLYGPKHAPYPITPHKPGGVLHWIGKDGKDVFARSVMHPGSPGNHMLAIAMQLTDGLARSNALFAGILREWVDAVEGSAK